MAEGPALGLSRPGRDKPQRHPHLGKPMEFPAPWATSANLFILFLFPPPATTPSIPSPPPGQPPPVLFTPHRTRSSPEICHRSAVTHLSLRYFGFITLQPVYPEEPQRANTEQRGNGGAEGRERGGNSSAAGLSKSQGLWLKLHWEAWPRPRSPPTTGDGMFRNLKASSLLFGNWKSSHAPAVLIQVSDDMGQSKVEGSTDGTVEQRLQNTVPIVCPNLLCPTPLHPCALALRRALGGMGEMLRRQTLRML